MSAEIGARLQLTPTPNQHPQPLSTLRNVAPFADLVLATGNGFNPRAPRGARPRLPYLYQRGVRSWATIELMQIGYAPGGCLRGWLTQLGHSLPALRQAGLVTGPAFGQFRYEGVARVMPAALDGGRTGLTM
jgi:hypothetical protein